jgi:AAA+ ATPase superfamily predicted ATPase
MKMTKDQKIIGRDVEQKIFQKIFDSERAEFLTVYGRRRVGKTFLIREYFQNKKRSHVFFYATGTNNGLAETQLKNFTKEIGDTFYDGMQLAEKDNWNDTLGALTQAIQRTPPRKKIIFFLDEFPWMVGKKSDLMSALEYYWNHHWSRDSRIKLIICGSTSGWLLKHIVNNKGGLYNRVTQTIHLKPFTLQETEKYFLSQKIRLNKMQIIHLYMVLGGIPFYLSKVESGLSAAQNVEMLAFRGDAFLLREFENLYATLFEEAQKHIDIVRLIAQHPYGIGQEEIINTIPSLSSGGRVVEWLSDLENAGFILRFKPFSNKRKGVYYKLIDEYSLFYFRWIEPIKDSLISQEMQVGYWESLQRTPAWSSWSGYAFESLCYKHIRQVAQALNLPVTAIPYGWRYAPTQKTREAGVQGAQIDLLFDRGDNSITLCEIKYTQSPFAIDKQYAEQLKQKMDTFGQITKTKKQIFLTLVSANGLKETMYSEALLDGSIDAAALFAP